MLAGPGISGSRARSVFTCQVLRPRRADATLAISCLVMLPSAFPAASAPGLYPYAAQWLACELSYRRFALALAGDGARLGADVVRYSFIGSDFHRLLLAGLQAPCEKLWTLPSRRLSRVGTAQAATQRRLVVAQGVPGCRGTGTHLDGRCSEVRRRTCLGRRG